MSDIYSPLSRDDLIEINTGLEKRIAELEQRLADAKARIEDITIKFSEAMGELNKSNSEDALWDLFNDIKHIKG